VASPRPAQVAQVPKMTSADPALREARALAAQQANAAQAFGALAPAVHALGGVAVTPSGQVIAPQQALPAQAQHALTQLSQQYAAQPQQTYQAQVARAQVARVQDAIDPQLATIRQQLDYRGTQIDATAEHREIVAEQKFRHAVLRKLAMIERAARIPRY